LRYLLIAALGSSLLLGSESKHHEEMAEQIRGELGFLASDALQGRGSGTHDELVAATYLASELRQIGIEPAGDSGSYIQNVVTQRRFRGETQPWNTRNVLGILHGRDEKLKDEAILLSAHLDHVGVGRPVNADEVYNGADDDASGCVAVLQLARALAEEEKGPKRTVIFAFFGSEETGGQGDQYFLQHPPVPLNMIVANLEFEMIGRPDPAVKPNELWLTGFDRSDLGPELAKHGAHLVADPHPTQHFFQRSDNFALARDGVVAQTVSSFGLHQDYHQPSDDLAHIDFAHMQEAIDSMIEPVKWLANTDFKPEWVNGRKP
jgi:Zn-dependent M28 family amino/carboxypeptidase